MKHRPILNSTLLLAGLLCVAVSTGCRIPAGRFDLPVPAEVAPRESPAVPGPSTEADESANTPDVDEETGFQTGEFSSAAENGIDKRELSEVLQALEELGQTDPELQRDLMSRLREVIEQAESDPAVWSRMRGTLLAAISYRRQIAERRLEAATASEAEQPPNRNTAGAAQEATATISDRLEALVAQQRAAAPRAAPTPDDDRSLEQPRSLELEPAVTKPPEPDSDRGLRAGETLPASDRNPWNFGREGTALKVPGPAAEESTAEPLSGDWRSHLGQAISALESQTEHHPQTAEEINRHASLRMLYLLANDRERAVAPIGGIAPELQDFWSNQLYGLAVYRDVESIEDPQRRATEAATHLRYANQRLGEAGILEVRNLAFCRSAQGFGLYEPFDPYEFAAGQQVVLYLEVENFRTESSSKGHYLSLSGSYQIVDSRGQLQADGDLGTYQEHCRTRRRDLYYSSLLQLPAALSGGEYLMHVTVEDNVSRKLTQASIRFSIRGGEPSPNRLLSR